MSDYELPENRLSTTDESGDRVYIHPHDVKGKWTNLRKKIYWGLILFYLIVPWIVINGQQIIKLDLPKREFYIFGATFYGHDGPFLIFVLFGFLFLISYITSIWGRVWCGYACPQTVFIDTIYRFIERKVEGSGPKRDKLERSPWNSEKIFKRGLKWFLYTVASMHIVHSGIGYFVGTHELLHITMKSPTSNMYLFILMLSLTLIILIDFGWFREQFCIIACPYGRFQSLVMDESSLIVAYDTKRGEPRKRTKGVAVDDIGDCVNCNRCVNVCPTGIDIRDGLQMECIACTMCIDACDEIMLKVNKPEGLIRYTTENELHGKKNKKGPRVYIYLALFILTCMTLLFSLENREHLKAQILRGSNSPYQEIKSESKILNHFKVRVRYMNSNALELQMKIVNSDFELISPDEEFEIVNENKLLTFFVKFDSNLLKEGRVKTNLIFIDMKTGKEVIHKELSLVGPINDNP